MSDLAQSDVHGPVATLRTELETRDAATDRWQPSKPTLTRFRPDEQILEADTQITFTYDKAGRLLETRFQDGKIVRTYVRIDEKGN